MDASNLLSAVYAVSRFLQRRVGNDASNKMFLRANTISAYSTLGYIEAEVDGSLAPSVVDGSKLLSCLRGITGKITLSTKGDRLWLNFENGSISLPDYDLPYPSSMGSPSQYIAIRDGDFTKCIGQVSPLLDRTEVSYAPGQRIYTEFGRLHFIASTRKTWGCASTECESGEIDFVCPTESLQAASSAVGNEDVAIGVRDGKLVVAASRKTMVLPQVSGKPPRTPSSIEPAWQGCRVWLVQRDDLLAFLNRCQIFVTEEASGIWLMPADGGLNCQYTGIADGTYGIDLSVEGGCSQFLPGQADGDPIYINQKMLRTAVLKSEPVDFHIKVINGGAAVCSDNYTMGVALMVPPAKK